MARNSGWRRECPGMVRVRQIRGPHIFLIRQGGPAAFVLHEEGRSKPVRVRLGDPHLCSCKTFQKEHDLCSHICWILLKKLQLKPDDPLSFQLGLVPLELEALIQGKYKKAASTVKKHCPPSPDSSPVPNRPISPRDACAICLENLIKSRKTVMCCRYGCGRPVHICCMMVLANYQKLNTPHLQCPMCRGDFATREELQKEDRRRRQRRLQLPPIPPPPQALAVHQGMTCTGCLISPVIGKLYRCVQCSLVYLCTNCAVSTFHRQHGLTAKQTPQERWRPVQDGVECKSELALPVMRLHRDLPYPTRAQQCSICLSTLKVSLEDSPPVRKSPKQDPSVSKSVDSRRRRRLRRTPAQHLSLDNALQVHGISLTDRRDQQKLPAQADLLPQHQISVTKLNADVLPDAEPGHKVDNTKKLSSE